MFLVDWFSFSSKIDSISSIIELLHLEDVIFEEVNGFYGYHDSLKYDDMRIHYNPRSDDMGILVEFSGTGCRAFETYSTTSFDELFIYVNKYNEDYNITRLDVAFDDKEGIIPINRLADDTVNQNYVSKFREWDVHTSSKGITVYLGSSSSDTYLRIYDKAKECGVDGHWIRVELQLRRNHSAEFIRQYLISNDLGMMFTGVLSNYIRFVKPSKTDINKQRWSMRKYWGKLLNNAIKIKLFAPCDIEYNMQNLHNYVIKQAGGALDTYIKINGIDKLQGVLKQRKVPLNKKYERLIEQSNNGSLRY